MLHETSFQIINIYSISVQKRAPDLLWHLLSQGVVCINYGFWKLLLRVHTINVTLLVQYQNIWFLYPLHNYSPLKTKRQIKKIIVIQKKKNGQRRYKYLVLGRYKSYFVKKNDSDSPKNVLWNWYHLNAWHFDWQHMCYVWWVCFSTESRHSFGY